MLNAFGMRRDFWQKYDAFSDKLDKDMLARLNTNLDVLLIFAGLFSAVNTGFIVVTLTTLSANPADETNHLLRLLVMNASNYTLTENDLSPLFTPGQSAIQQNCTFFASLCCSLLAAAGAVLAKQWLQSYERTGKIGTMEEQAIRRTEKSVGAENWGLRPVVETLATLLLVSLTLFFIASIDYLWVANETVAIVVLAFTATGWLLYVLMVILAAIFSACPFQTGPSVALRQFYFVTQRLIYSPNIELSWVRNIPFRSHINTILEWLYTLMDALPGNYKNRILYFSFLALIFPTYIVFGLTIPLLQRLIPRNDDLSSRNMNLLHVYSAVLMVEYVPNTSDVVTVADNIPLISDIEAVRVIATTTALPTLLSHLQTAFIDVRSGGERADLTNALTLAKAVVHIVFADPKRSANMVRKCLLFDPCVGCVGQAAEQVVAGCFGSHLSRPTSFAARNGGVYTQSLRLKYFRTIGQILLPSFGFAATLL
ncbi:hypothetical protein FRB94_006691 [Tulasnella sp. JGI-2019a]|nr:hypothetical protein FRB93_008028 [Tulasnella sp. JGI-2019a]KAG8998758.1 hypothetical protein FRB94_006691 [Tulasnella sp. JGI-2019a]